MKTVTRNNLLKLVEMKKEYELKKSQGITDNELLNLINSFVENVINKDQNYYRKLSSYKFDNDILDFLM